LTCIFAESFNSSKEIPSAREALDNKKTKQQQKMQNGI
jgi:hypothetical protein